MDSQYKELTSYIRSLKSKELQTGKYPHLRANRPKAKLPSFEEHNFLDERFRINFIFRPKVELSLTQGNLEVGKTEILLEYNGILTEDYKSGFPLNEDKPIRIAQGEYLFGEMLDPIMFNAGNHNLLRQVYFGHYETFVKNSLFEVNRIVDFYKNLYKNNEIKKDLKKAPVYEKSREERKKYISKK